MKIGLAIAARCAGAILLLLTAACGNPQTGTQTNWLRDCQSDSQCGDELQCRCGTCTLACQENSPTCGGRPGAVCVAASDVGAVALCGGSPAPLTGLCLQRCTQDDCPSGAACIAGVCAPLREATDVVTVDVAVRFQTLVGFGAGTGWMTDEIAKHPQKAALYDAMFTNSGLDLIRLLNRYDDFGTSDLRSSVDVVGAAAERLGSRPTLLLTSSSPPAALKANNSEICSGNPDTCTLAHRQDGTFDYRRFASHWRATLEAYAAAAIPPDYISIQNDPDWVPPASSKLDACLFLPKEGTRTIGLNGKNVQVRYPGYSEAIAAVKSALVGLPSIPRLAGPDSVGVESTVTFASQLDPGSLDVLGHHMYGTDPSAIKRDSLLSLNELGRRSALPIFQTEMQAEGLGTAILMHEALSTIGASVYVQNDFASSAFLPSSNPAALIALGETDFKLQEPYHAMRHFAHDTAPGWVRVAAESTQRSVLATAWLSPSGDSLTVVLVNPKTTTVAVRLGLSDGSRTNTRVSRTVFRGVERSVVLGALPSNGVVVVPGEAIVTVVARK